jgi:hypothetical protein
MAPPFLRIPAARAGKVSKKPISNKTHPEGRRCQAKIRFTVFHNDIRVD